MTLIKVRLDSRAFRLLERLGWLRAVGGIMGVLRLVRYAATLLPVLLILGVIPGAAQAETSRAPIQVTRGASQEDVYEGGRLGLITRNAPARSVVSYEIWSGSSWTLGGTARASDYGSALWSMTVPLDVSSVRVRVRAGKVTSRPLTVPVKASDGWNFWDQTHIGQGGILQQLITPDGRTIRNGHVFPLAGQIQLLDAWGQRVLVSRSNGSTESVYLWEPGMREARFLLTKSFMTLQVSFGRSPDEILAKEITYAGTGLSRSQYDDLIAYDSMGRQTGLLWRLPQDPYGTTPYIETTSFTVDRSSGQIYFTGFWNVPPRRNFVPRSYQVMTIREGAAPVETNVSSKEMLANGEWLKRVGTWHFVSGKHNFITDIQVVNRSAGFFIQDPTYSGGQVCTFRIGAPYEAPASCFRVNTGEFVSDFVMQNSRVGYVIELIQSNRDYIVRQLDLSLGVDKGMVGRASRVAIGGK